jgi:hypothetical protein
MKEQSQGRVELRQSALEGGGLGGFALTDFSVGEVLFSVPREIMLSSATARHSNAEIDTAARKCTELTEETLLFAFICLSLKDNYYLQSLSTESPRCHLSMSELAGSNVAAQLARDEEECITQLQLLQSQIPRSGLTLDKLLWARGHYNSRRYPLQFSTPHIETEETTMAKIKEISSKKRGREQAEQEQEQEDSKERRVYDHSQGSMVPLLDILNHKSGDEEWLNFDLTTDPTALLVRTNIPYKKGDEIMSNYGCKSNDQLLFQFGFCDKDSKFDSFSVKTGGATFDLRPNTIPEELLGDGGEGLYAFLKQKQKMLAPKDSASQHAPSKYYMAKQRALLRTLKAELKAGRE